MATHQELVIVEPKDWVELRDLYQHDWPRYQVAYFTVQNYIEWNGKQLLPENVKIYSLPGAWQKDGTIIVVTGDYLFTYTMDETHDTLRRTLLAFEWDRTYLVAMTMYRSVVLDVYSRLGLEKILDVPNVFYHLPQEQAAQLTLTLPEGFTTGPVDPQSAYILDDHWLHKEPGTDKLIEGLLQRNFSVGLYDSLGHLVGWCIQGENGALQMLGVTVKRKGYGSIVTKAYAKFMAARGLNTFACVMAVNKVSRALFLKLGFEEQYDVDYLKNGVRKIYSKEPLTS